MPFINLQEPISETRDQVRDHYAEHARSFLQDRAASCCGSSTSSSCCGTDSQVSCCSTEETIPVQAIAALRDNVEIPNEIVQMSLGCGTPLELAALQKGETVLDLGSGSGLDCFFAARLVGETGHVIGVDMTPEMLNLANENKQKVGLLNVEFRRGYLEALPVDDASVDVIISNCVINLSADKDAVFREAHRVLKPNGRVVFSDIVARAALPLGLQKNMEAWAGCVAGAIPSREYQEKMRRAGFTNINVVGQAQADDLIFSAKLLATK